MMKETIDLLGKIFTNILTALYEPFGFSFLLSFLAMFFYLYAYKPIEAGKDWKNAMVYWERLNGDLMKYLDLHSLLIHFYTEYDHYHFQKQLLRHHFV